jgi:hypothetical protein
MDTATLLPIVHNPKNKFTVARLHYSADAVKNTKEWIEEARRGMPERGWLREYEIDYSVYEGKTFFPEFKDFNIKAEEYQTHETIYRGWDYGFHRPCVVITKLNQFDQWCWIDMILGKDEGIMAFGKRVRQYCLTRFPGAYYVDAGDPAGEQQSDKSEKTSVQVLESIGIFVRSRKQPILQGAEIIRQKLPMRVDGRPGLIVHPKLTTVVDGFKGGLHYPEAKEGRPQQEFYEKDGFYDHIFDAGRYIAVDMFTVIGEQQQPNQMTMDNEDDKHRYRMGRPADQQQQNDLSDLANDLVSDSTDLGEYW